MAIAINKKFVGVVSASLLSGAVLWEGTKYEAYYDIAGVPTVCMGYTGKGIVFGKKYSHEECTNFLRTELVVHGKGVLECISKPLEEHTYNAFTLMAYNVGTSGFCNSRAAKLYNQGYSKEACYAMYRDNNGKPVWSYAKVDGKLTFVKGLYNRRKYEAAMCLGDSNAKLD